MPLRRLFLLLVLFGLLGPARVLAERTLTVLTWSDYLDPALAQRFEQQFDVELKLVYFETDDMRDEMLIETEARGYDLVLINGYDASKYVKRGWLSALAAAKIPNLKHLDPRWRSAYPDVETYAVPYFWGTTGIAYRSDLVEAPITHWRQLFAPAEYLRGKIVMIKTAQDVIGMALKSLGYSANSTEHQELAEVEQLLIRQRPYVKTYSYVSVGKDATLVTGETFVAMIYNGDAVALRQHSLDIRYVVPEEGTNLWCDYFAVVSSSDNTDLAWRFIDFLNEPQNAAQNAQFVWFATPNKAAARLLPDAFLNDPVIYPSQDVLDRSENYTQLPPTAVRTRNELFSKLLN